MSLKIRIFLCNRNDFIDESIEEAVKKFIDRLKSLDEEEFQKKVNIFKF